MCSKSQHERFGHVEQLGDLVVLGASSEVLGNLFATRGHRVHSTIRRLTIPGLGPGSVHDADAVEAGSNEHRAGGKAVGAA